VPIYRYRCDDCEETFSALEFSGEPATQACEHCGSTEIVRVPGVPGVLFKGKGFYVTDNRRSGSSGAKSNGATTPASSESKSGAGADSGSSGSTASDQSKAASS